MRETGGGDSSPSEGETASASDERKEKRFWIRPRRPTGRPNDYDSTTTTHDFLRLGLYSVVVVVLLPALLAVSPTIPSAPINSHELPLYSSSPVPSAPQQACLTPSTSPTPLPPCTRCVTCASSTYFVTRGPPSPASIPPSPPNG